MVSIESGSIIKFTYKDTEMTGVVINFSGGKYSIKLTSGYNLSVPSESLEKVELTGHVDASVIAGEAPGRPSSNGTRIGIIGTGGTIASRVDYITGAVTPVTDPSFLRDSVTNLTKYSIELNLKEAVLSENLIPKDWIRIARNARDMLSRNSGAVILHGTDTMSYTASALAFMFQQLSGPVVFAGSQRSPDRPSSDAFLNLDAALEFAASGIGEVGIAMHSGTSDSDVALHRAVRSRKMHSSRRDAFRSVGSEPIGSYVNGKVKLSKGTLPKSDETVLADRLEERVSLVYFHPALREDDFRNITEGKRSVVIMGTGLGHAGKRLYPAIREIVGRGDHVLMTTQCLFGGVNMNVYSTGRELLSLGVVPLGDMLPEVAMIKSMFLLANYPEEDFRKMILANLRGEILERETLTGGI